MQSVHFSHFHLVELVESFFYLRFLGFWMNHESNCVSLFHVLEIFVRSNRLDQNVVVIDVFVGFLSDFVFD